MSGTVYKSYTMLTNPPDGFTVSIDPGSLAISQQVLFAAPPPIGSTSPNTGAFTTLQATTPIGITSGGTGTNAVPGAGSLLIGNSSAGWTVNQLTAGPGINIANSSGAITISGAVTGSSFTRTTITASGGQTTFSVSYSVGSIQVYLNGVMLAPSDYTATSGTSVVLGLAAAAGDIFDAFSFTPQNITGVVPVVNGGSGTSSLSGYVYGNGTSPFTASTTIPATALSGILAAANGGTGVASTSLMPVTATGSTTARTLAAHFADVVNVKDFGAVGDGTTNDTAAFNAAISASITPGSSLFIPAGIYIVDQITVVLTSASQGFYIFCPDGPENTTLRKRVADANPLFVIGSATSVIYMANIIITGVQFQGGLSAQSACVASVVSYDLVRSQFINCIFSNSQNGMLSNGGISNSWVGCQFINNVNGIKLDKFTSLAGGGYPNNNSLVDPGVTNNTGWGVYFNNGRVLNIINIDLEGNGTTGNAATGGIYVNNVNSEGSGAAPATGLNLQGGWGEGNAGDASIQLNSGVNNIADFYLVANPATTYDIHVVAGTYHLDSVAFGSNKTSNLKEESGTVAGSTIIVCEDALVGTFNYNSAKTTWIGAANSGSGVLTPAVLMRSGAVPVVMSTANPMMLTGTATTNGSGNVVVTFSTAFTAAPIVMTQIVDASTTQVESVQTSAISTSGFTINATKMVSGSNTVSGLASASIQWIAIGAT